MSWQSLCPSFIFKWDVSKCEGAFLKIIFGPAGLQCGTHLCHFQDYILGLVFMLYRESQVATLGNTNDNC